ncbi:ABC-type bacteriocin/lantibiotic exporter with N-terminal double-glycine peptidase domain [Streptomyces lincolnensis]|uniref:ABC-type bacteriocin/lantibiotic exporter with N-terminal double-glycine peptidase domain n=1 Tax=Streptomyces lincolnensis TaxID=1915 RepID=A0A1B1MK48_STRLN|nr:ABC transporter ATP-binding protein [Streptomyces lincolnensis]ANS68996.1 ABC-type bacteriocin/lantibiotic exporter with N-terminal double-glycine peptidase domain [Streptomyces lincolnensis]AXG57915.1 ABC-type bacteriocin/lantibiotic exporter with N-terminal double-glycine peptidase domain [Streptomyces lincolnensis]QMV10587.1 ATP-binding cassette domain-containing protein [Streptomyces lincolnensis]
MTADTGPPPPAKRWVIPALIAYSFSEAPVVTTLTAVTAVIAGAAPVGITVAIGELVNGLTSAIGQGLDTPVARECYRWIALVVVLFLLAQLAESARMALGEALGRRVTGRLNERVMMAASEPATIGHLEDPAYLDRLRRARGDGTIDMPPGEAVFGFSTRASIWVTSIGSAALLTRATWGLGLIVFAVFAVIHSRLVRNYRTAVVETMNQSKKLRRTSYLRDVPTTPGAAREVRVFGLASFFRDAYQTEWRANMTEVWRRRREHDLFVVVVVVVTGVTVASAFYYLAYQAATGEATLGDLAVGGLAVRALLQMLRADDDDLRMGFGSKAAAEAFTFPVVASPVGPDKNPWPAPATTLSCEDLRFRYGGAAGEVLHGIDLAVPAGQSLAVVGLNGAGKTTLARLLAGLDAPSEGSVRVGDTPIEDANRRSWQRQVVAVFQDFGRYELTVRDNIAFGSLPHADDEEGLRAVARQAGLLKFIEGLPSGWDTVMSSGYSGGVDASGGEWQRIAIARALFGLRHGAQLLIMDEPAASLDARAEAQLYDTFHELTAGATTIAISHRFATVRKAERVVVLDHGRIIEDGTHEDLITADGRYAELFRLQAKRFEEARS